MSKTAHSYIRFSTPKQEKGGSVKRQVDAAAKWCKENGYTLSEKTYKDLGVSGFKGKHRTQGELGLLLSAVESGKIAKGEALIIESYDRLSREPLLKSFNVVRIILNAGVDLITLSPFQYHLTPACDDDEILTAMQELRRGHAESKRKSDFNKADWREKREAAKAGNIFGGNCPPWLTLVDGKWIVDTNKTAIIKRAFTLAKTIGCNKIAKTFITEGVASLNGKPWDNRRVAELLRNAKVMGHYQPCQAGKPIGDIIDNYYPQIITPSQFYDVQNKINDRIIHGKGRQGSDLANLFAGRLFSSVDKTAVYIRGSNTKIAGGKRKRYDYLRSVALIKQEPNADKSSFPYPIFEAAALEVLGAIRLPEEKDFGTEVDLLTGQLTDCQQRIKAVNGRIATAPDYSALLDVVMGLEDREKELKTALKTAKGKRPSTETLDNLREALAGGKRQEVKARLADLIEKIELTGQSACVATILFNAGYSYRFSVARTGELSQSLASGYVPYAVAGAIWDDAGKR